MAGAPAGATQPGGSTAPPSPAQAGVKPASKPLQPGNGAAAAAADDSSTSVWLPFSEVGMCWSEGDMPDGVKAQLGTFYQVMDTASGLQQVSGCARA